MQGKGPASAVQLEATELSQPDDVKCMRTAMQDINTVQPEGQAATASTQSASFVAGLFGLGMRQRTTCTSRHGLEKTADTTVFQVK